LYVADFSFIFIVKTKMSEIAVNIPDEILLNKIYLIREQKVMLDKDLSLLYGVKPRRLREQVKRNITRFPSNFMFQLTEEEANIMVSHFATPSKQLLGGSLPYVFTEHGILMLSNVLKSDQAIQVSIRIIEIFVKLREVHLNYNQLRSEIDQIKHQLGNQDKNIELIFNYFEELLSQKEKLHIPIGFKIGANGH
jgi:hypothetical protein